MAAHKVKIVIMYTIYKSYSIVQQRKGGRTDGLVTYIHSHLHTTQGVQYIVLISRV